MTPSNPSPFLFKTNPSKNTGGPHRRKNIPRCCLCSIKPRGCFKAVCAKLATTFLTYHLHTATEPLCEVPQLFPWCNTVCHHSTESFVRQMVAVQCSKTSGGISYPGYKLNNSRPCLPSFRLTHTHPAASIFRPLCKAPEGKGALSGLLPAFWVAKHSVCRGRSRKLWCFSCLIFTEVSHSLKQLEVAVKTNAIR